MNLEVGKTYVTRGGLSVTIEHDKGDHQYPFYGRIISADGSGRIAYFSSNGSYILSAESVFNITTKAP